MRASTRPGHSVTCTNTRPARVATYWQIIAEGRHCSNKHSSGANRTLLKQQHPCTFDKLRHNTTDIQASNAAIGGSANWQCSVQLANIPTQPNNNTATRHPMGQIGPMRQSRQKVVGMQRATPTAGTAQRSKPEELPFTLCAIKMTNSVSWCSTGLTAMCMRCLATLYPYATGASH